MHQHLRVNNFTTTGPTRWRRKWGTGSGAGQAPQGPPAAPRTTLRSARPGGGGAGEREATSPRRGSRPRAASPSARASSGCSPPQTPARLWLTAPCGAAGEWARGRAGPGVEQRVRGCCARCSGRRGPRQARRGAHAHARTPPSAPSRRRRSIFEPAQRFPQRRGAGARARAGRPRRAPGGSAPPPPRPGPRPLAAGATPLFPAPPAGQTGLRASRSDAPGLIGDWHPRAAGRGPLHLATRLLSCIRSVPPKPPPPSDSESPKWCWPPKPRVTSL